MAEIRNSAGEQLDFTRTPAAGERPRPGELVVIGHGVTGNKDREWAVTLAEALAGAGFSSVRFSFSGNGDSEGEFRDSTPTKEVGDLSAVLDHFEGECITYVGHSMGAAVGVLFSSTDKRVRRLVSLGGMVHTADFARRKFGDLVPGEGFMWDKPDCPLSPQFLHDMATIGSLADLAERIEIPWLLVHGTADSVVPIQESETMLERSSGLATLCRIDGADHVFSGEAADVMAGHVLEWLSAP